jgi:hypothetical protein
MVADCLSRKFNLNDNQLTTFCVDFYPYQIPHNFQICQLQQEISSWIYSIVVLQRTLNPKKFPPPPPSVYKIGEDRWNIWAASIYHPIHSSTVSLSPASNAWQEDSFSCSEKDPAPPPSLEETLMEIIHHGYLDGASKKPLGTWVWNAGMSIGKAPFTSMTISKKFIPKLVELFTAWTNEDPPPAKVTALDINHLRFLFSYSHNQKNKYLIHQTHPIASAFFFGMHPCEYSSV